MYMFESCKSFLILNKLHISHFQDFIHPNSNSNVASTEGQLNDEIAMELNENKSDWKLKIDGKPTKLFVKKVFFIETNLSNPSKPKSVLKSLANNPKYYKVEAKDAESLQKVDDWLQTQPTGSGMANWFFQISSERQIYANQILF